MSETKPEWPEIYWLTRDQDGDGVLSFMVDVWVERPTRMALPGGGWMWLGEGTTGLEARLGSWKTGDKVRPPGTLPETERECVRVGPEPVAVKRVA